jgi:hypothetical protein
MGKPLLLGLFFASLAYGNLSHYPEGGYASHAGTIVGVYEGSYKKYLPLSLQLGMDGSFTQEQTNLIKEATSIFVERALSRDVLNCAYSNTSKGLPASPKQFELQLYSALAILDIKGVNVPSFVFVSRYWDDPKSVGRGFVGLFYDEDKPLAHFSSRHYLHIALNSDHLGPTSTYHLKNDPEYWAGVIAHEVLHNLGYKHSSGYAGSFIQEYGYCVQHNGVDEQRIEGEIFDTQVFKEL